MNATRLITRYAHDFAVRYRRRANARILSGLPRDIQKDIGWPDGSGERSLDAGSGRGPHSQGRH